MPCPECEFDYIEGQPDEEAKHQQFHQCCLFGPETSFPDRTYFIDRESPRPLRVLAESASEMGRQDAGFDFPFFTAEESPPGITVLLNVLNGRAMAGVVTAKRTCDRRARLSEFTANPFVQTSLLPANSTPVHGCKRTAVLFIWVARAMRGHNFAEQLLASLADHHQTNLGEFAFAIPIRLPAFKLLSRMDLSDIFIVSNQNPADG
jgi:zinc-finger of acetyl-transferase ESCO